MPKESPYEWHEIGGTDAKPRVPFLPVRINWKLTHPSYCKMIFQLFSPHFCFCSTTFVLLLITTLCMVIPPLFLPPSNYNHFLAKTDLPYVYLQPASIRRHPLLIYQCFTSMFFHSHYRHFTSTMTVVFFKMAPL